MGAATSLRQTVNQVPPSVLHHPVSISSSMGPIFKAEVKANRVDFVFLLAGLDSVVEVAIQIVNLYQPSITPLCG